MIKGTTTKSSATKTLRKPAQRPRRPLRDWPAAATRTEGGWGNRPDCPMVPRIFADSGFLRDRLSLFHGSAPLPADLSDTAVDATLSLMLRRGK